MTYYQLDGLLWSFNVINIRNIVFLFLICVVNNAISATLPFYAQPAYTLQVNESPKVDHTRLKISVTSDEIASDNQVRLGNVTVCSELACFRPPTPAYINLDNTTDGKSEGIAEFSIPFGIVRSIHFESVPGQKSVVGDITLQFPLKIEKDFPGYEIMTVLKKTVDGDNIRYNPTAIASNIIRLETISVYYNPHFAMEKKLPYKSRFSLKAGATEQPQVFSVGVRDIRNRFAAYDIYPAKKLLQPGSISSFEINRGYQIAGQASTEKNVASEPYVADGTSPKSVGNTKSSIILHSTGFIELGFEESFGADSTRLSIDAQATAGASCSSILSSNKQVILSGLASTGSIYLDSCTTIPPYIHIAVTKTLDFREKLYIDHQLSGGPLRELNLKRIAEFGAPGQISINGFTWTGDSGLLPGGRGRALGFVQRGDLVLGNNIVGGGFGGGTFDSNKFAFLAWPGAVTIWKEGAIPPLFIGQPDYYNNVLIGTSTSIVKNGSCTNVTGSLISRWSAVGSSTDGLMIFVSSTSTNSAAAADFCSVFQALGANNALRLDGGPSASMRVDGLLLNPLQGLDARYGVSRPVAYALRMAWASGSSPATPNPLARSTVPPNPCKAIPRPPGCT